MKYRVRYTFRGQRHGYHYTEWYETVDDALAWVAASDGYGELFPQAVEDEDGNVV